MTIVADTHDFVVGVDTHARSHTFAVIDTHSGAVRRTESFPNTPAGMRRGLTWINHHGGDDALVVVEGIGSYGAGIARLVADGGHRVVETLPIPAVLRRGKGKTDQIDAALIGRSIIGVDDTRLRQPRADLGLREASRILVGARTQMNRERTKTINTLTALVRTIDLDIDARAALTKTQIKTIAAWRTRHEPLAQTIARAEAVRLATRIIELETQLAANRTQLDTLIVDSPVVSLLNQTGIATITAAAIYVAWSHPKRIHSEAAWAALAGVAPIPASSGNTTRHRLNHGGDRHLNQALTTIVLTRLRHDPQTRAYHTRRLAQGLSTKEIMRILKRYIARQIYRELAHTTN